MKGDVQVDIRCRGLTDSALMPDGFEASGLSLEGVDWQKLAPLGLTIFASVFQQLDSVATPVSAKILGESLPYGALFNQI